MAPNRLIRQGPAGMPKSIRPRRWNRSCSKQDSTPLVRGWTNWRIQSTRSICWACARAWAPKERASLPSHPRRRPPAWPRLADGWKRCPPRHSLLGEGSFIRWASWTRCTQYSRERRGGDESEQGVVGEGRLHAYRVEHADQRGGLGGSARHYEGNESARPWLRRRHDRPA